MKIDKIRVTCTPCGHVFDAEIVVDAPIAVAAASMSAISCPQCGSRDCGLGGNYDDAPPVTAPLTDRVRWWKERGEHGISSETIYSAFCGGMPRYVSYPRDPDDFRRCKLLLDLIPEWRADLGKVSRRYVWFAPMIEKWDEIERLYLEEEALYNAGKISGPHECYKLMRLLGEHCDIVRRAATSA